MKLLDYYKIFMTNISFLFILILTSCSSNNSLLELMPNNNILIYSAKYKEESNLGDTRYKNIFGTGFIKINKNEKTIQFNGFTYEEGKEKDINKIDIDSLFKNRPVKHFNIKSNKIKTLVYVTKYKRGWFDFATPGRSKSGGDKYYIGKDSTINGYKLNKQLTEKANRK